MRGPGKLASRLARIACAALMLAPTVSVAQAAAPHPALWRVQQGTSTVYLFGSLHVLPAGYAWTTPEIDAAKAAADSFIFEVPVDEAALKDEKQFIVEKGILAKGQTLRGVLEGSEFQTYSAVL
ncbi:MAG TPA: TraB/GumN family protein, partial [Micropepsaceae bacterium]|nr:TraB/GumN family protein [Micropepsaceae bacterium]